VTLGHALPPPDVGDGIIAAVATEPEPFRVTTLELFFDLVFVFTIAELTSVLFAEPNARGLVEVFLMLGVIWWMYGGYAWLTNAVSARTTLRRLVLLGGMGGYFVVALAVPGAFEGSGLAFGLGYLAVVLVHATLFTRASGGAARGILTLAPFNLASAGLVLLGGALGGRAQYVLWALAVAFEWLTPRLRKPSAFTISAAHFVERHGLVIIVAIGESVVAVGIGAAHLDVDLELAAIALVGLALSACLWWVYFGGGDEEAEEALAALPQRERSFAALNAFGYWHFPLLLGIVAIASVEREAIAHPFDELSWARAAILAAGVGIFLAGDVCFRRVLRIGPSGVRIAAAVLVAAAVPVGVGLSAFAEIAVLVALLAGMLVLERPARDRRAVATVSA
jgi:low temperature requirement protein LtrA